MKVINIISQHKRARGRMVEGRIIPAKPIAQGMRRVMAIVEINGERMTRHIDVPRK